MQGMRLLLFHVQGHVDLDDPPELPQGLKGYSDHVRCMKAGSGDSNILRNWTAEPLTATKLHSSFVEGLNICCGAACTGKSGT
jgi:hypothetical protein